MTPPTPTLLEHLRRLTCPPAADAVLLSRWVQQRDEAAFAALVARHGPMVLGVCQRVFGDAHEAEDAFQATFLILARKAASLRRPEALACWLHGVASRLARKSRAAAQRRAGHSRSLTVEPPDSRPDPLDLLTVREMLGLIDGEIRSLREVYRLPVVLCDLEGRTQEEASALLGWTPGSLRGRLLRGRARLKARLARRGLTLPAGIALPLVPAALAASLPASSPVVSPQLVSSVTRAAVRFSMDSAAAELSGPAVDLAREGLRVLMLSKVKLAAAALLTMTVFVAGAGLLGRHIWEAKPVEERREDKTPPAANSATKPAMEKPQVRFDRFGDPLPEGAVARLGTVRLRHGSTVTSVAFSPDRKTLASGGQENRVRLWEIATGKELRRFTAATGPKGEPAWVQSIAFSPDGKFLAVGTSNVSSELVVWQLATGKEVRRFQGIRRLLTSIAFAPDGNSLAASDADGLIRLWNVADGALWRQLKGHPSKVEAIAFSPKGDVLASAGRDKTIRLWDPDTGRELRQLKGHTDRVLAVAFTPDGKKLASSGWGEQTIRLWDATTGKELRVLNGNFLFVTTLVFLADGQTLASSGHDGVIRLWNATTGKELRRMDGHIGLVLSIALSPDGKTLASGGVDRTVRLWDLAKGQELRPTEGHQTGVRSVAFSPDGKQIASGSEVGEVRLWDSATSKEIRALHDTLRVKWIGIVDHLDFSPDGETLRAASWNFTLYQWKTATGKPLGERAYKGVGLIPTSDGKFVVSSSGDGTVFVQEAATTKLLREFQNQKQGVNVAVSPDGKFLAAGSPGQDGTVVVWELATGEERCRCKGAYDRVGSLAFSPDGKYLAGTTTRSRFFTPQSPVHLWDAATGGEVRQFQVQGHALSLVFSSDGRTLVSGGEDKTVRLWETATGKERRRFVGHQGIVRAVAISPDGTRLVSASDDTTALVWDATVPIFAGKLSDKQLQAAWSDLASDDAVKAYRAIWLLARHPAQSVPLLRENVPPARALDAEKRKQIERWLTDLDSGEAAVRERASAELEKQVVMAEPMLRKALTGRPSLEQRKRIERVLERLDQEKVMLGRALEVLEHAPTPQSRQLLETFAAGESSAWLTQDAKSARQRQ